MKKPTLKEQRNNALYMPELILSGNDKLRDYDDAETGTAYRYAQFNTRAVLDCPFRSAGCERVCYATKGRHNCENVKASRSRSADASRRADFAEAMTYTIKVEKQAGRYAGKVMLIRIHESGDFYSVQYLRKWVRVWAALADADGVQFVFYTKSFPFFLKLTDAEKDVIRDAMRAGRLSMNLSMDDTTSAEQRRAYLKMLKEYPLANTYYCTTDVDAVDHDTVCDCADCAKCGTCNKAQGKRTVVKIHSASKKDTAEYDRMAGK